MVKREQAFTTDLQKIFKRSLPTSAVEVKVAQKRKNGHRLCRSQFPAHQWAALEMASHSVLVYKIADEGMSSKPFDIVVLRGVPSFVCAVFGRNFYVGSASLVSSWFKTEASISEEEFERMAEYKGTL